MDYSLNEIDNRVIELDTTKATQADNLRNVCGVAYDTQTGVFTFTFQNGSTFTADLNIEKIPVSFSMSAEGILTMTTADGSTYTADIAELIKEYIFIDSDTLDFETSTDISGNKRVMADVKDGSITGRKLRPDYLADITVQAEIATAQAGSAAASAESARQSAERAAQFVVEPATTAKAGIVKPDGTTITVDPDGTIHSQGGGGGTGNYNDLENKPQINGQILSGNQTAPALGLATPSEVQAVAATITDAYSSSKAYKTGDYFIYNNLLYKVKADCTGITPPNATYYEQTSIGREQGGIRFGIDGEGNRGYFGADDSFVPFKSGGGGGTIFFAYATGGPWTMHSFYTENGQLKEENHTWGNGRKIETDLFSFQDISQDETTIKFILKKDVYINGNRFVTSDMGIIEKSAGETFNLTIGGYGFGAGICLGIIEKI